MAAAIAANTASHAAFRAADAEQQASNLAYRRAITANRDATLAHSAAKYHVAIIANALADPSGHYSADLTIIYRNPSATERQKEAARDRIVATAKRLNETDPLYSGLFMPAALAHLPGHEAQAATAEYQVESARVVAQQKNNVRLSSESAYTVSSRAVTAAMSAAAATARALAIQQTVIPRLQRDFRVFMEAETGSSPSIVALAEAFRGLQRTKVLEGAAGVDKHNEGVVLVESIEALHDGIAGVEASYATLKAAVDAAQSAQEDNNEAIDANTEAIERNAAELAYLKNSIDYLSTGIAGAMSLSGTPRLVGEDLRITMGAASFEGKEAVGVKIQRLLNDSLAVGVGYAEGDSGVFGKASGSLVSLSIGL